MQKLKFNYSYKNSREVDQLFNTKKCVYEKEDKGMSKEGKKAIKELTDSGRL